jgi:hypothetical protein
LSFGKESTPRVLSVALRAEPEPVYNIEVEGDHCYPVGEQGLLVYNALANPNNPNIVVDASVTSSSIYRATDCTNPNHSIRGTLGGQGVLEFTLVGRTPGQTSAVSGQDFVAAMMAHFGPANVKTIKGHWIAGIDLGTNIDQFNALTRQGLSDIDAAKNVWTGQRAKDYGFLNVKIDFKDPPRNAPGQYVEVIASFTR